MAKIEEILSNVSAERGVVSILLQNPDRIIECSSEEIYSEHFAVRGNQVLYSVICHLVEQGTERFDSNVVYSTVQDEVAKADIDELGGRLYIDTLLQASIISSNLTTYIRLVKEASLKRRVHELAESIKQDVRKADSVSELIINTQKKILEISLSNGKETEAIKMGENTLERLKLRALNPNSVFGYSIGWKNFDRITQGFCANDLSIVCAPSKTGKSALLTNFAKILSVDTNLPGLYLDTEMSTEEQEDRMLAIMSGVPFTEIRNGLFAIDSEYGIGIEKQARLEKAVEILKERNLIHIYVPNFNVENVTGLIRKYKIQENIGYAIFDYIKLPNGDVNSLNSAQEYQRLGYFTTCLKDMAGICKIPIISACQSNRNDLENTDPDASSIGGSYRIIQMATRIMFLRNKTDGELVQENYQRGNQKLHIKYQRNGSGDEAIDIHFDRPILRMGEVN